MFMRIPQQAAEYLRKTLVNEFARVTRLSSGKLLQERYRKFRKMCELSQFSQEAMNHEVELLLLVLKIAANNSKL